MCQDFEFPIGTVYQTRGKHPRKCTVTDQLTVTNSRGKVVRRYYKSVHVLNDQLITDHDVRHTTIAMGSPVLPEG